MKSGKKLAICRMLSSSKKHVPLLDLFTGLVDQPDQKHPFYLLAYKIQWPVFEDAFKIYYSENMGKP
jgi:hypothetical protein